MAKKNRGKRGRQNAIRSFLAPLTPQQAKREARARTRLEFGEVGRALRSEMDASRQQSKNLNAWYQQYQNNMDRLRQGQLANTNALQEQSRQSAGLMNDAAAAQRTALNTEEAASAALRGATTSGAGATEAAGATQRQNLMAATRDANAQLGSSAYNRLAEVNAAADLGRQADQRQERNTQLKIRSKMRDLKRDKGAARLKNYRDIVQGERDYSIQKQGLAKDYGYQDAMRYVADQGLARAQTSAGATKYAADKYTASDLKTAKIYARGQNGQAITGSDIKTGLAHVNQLVADAPNSGKYARDMWRNPRALRTYLISKKNLDPKLAAIVVRRWRNTGPSPGSKSWSDKNKERSGR